MRELVPAALPPSFQESRELEETIELLEPLAFVLNSQLEQLMERLVERSLATDLVPYRDIGLMLSGDAGDGTFCYALALLNGAPDSGTTCTAGICG